MYDLQYVKKRRRRKVAALVSLFSGIGITSLVIISFFTGRVGTFSVSVSNSSVKLSLCENEKFDNPTSYLRLDSIHTFQEMHYLDLPKAEILDNELTKPMDEAAVGYDDQGNVECMYYLKYTFYVKNLGNTPAKYNLSINLSEANMTTDGTNRTLDDTVRVMVFENDPTSDVRNEPKIYAKEAVGNNYLSDGTTITRREFVGWNKIGGYESEEHPLAETFVSPSIVCTYNVSNFTKDSIKRYTIVFWLEGEDPQSVNSDDAPEDAKIKFGVEIKAYEEA